MKATLKIWVCEFITGGGLYREPLPQSLAREGMLMRDALLSDLRGVAGIDVFTTHDARLNAFPGLPSRPIQAADDLSLIWQACMAKADAVWIIAPESGQVLLQLTQQAESLGKQVIGSTADAVRIATSKSATLSLLAQQGIATVPLVNSLSDSTGSHSEWVCKPDDGAGCGDTWLLKTLEQALDAAARQVPHGIVQPFIQGEPGSLSMLCGGGPDADHTAVRNRVELLSCNRQAIQVIQDGNRACFAYTGSAINGLVDEWDSCAQLAQAVANALPGLRGYVGVDFIRDTSAGAAVLRVLEINPRLTTSYVGLRQAIGYNPARLILDLLYNPQFTMPELSRHPVEISVYA